MDTEELFRLQPGLLQARHLPDLRRIRCLVSGNRSAKDRLTAKDAPLSPLLAALVEHVIQLADQLCTASTASDDAMPDAVDAMPVTDSDEAFAEASESVLILHSIMITHPAAFVHHQPRRLISSLLCLMNTRAYDLILSCLRFLHALCTHLLPHADPRLQPAAQALVLTSADLLSDAKLLKLLLLSMSKNALVRELILGIFAGLAFGCERCRLALEEVADFDATCPLSCLQEAGDTSALYTLLCYYSLLTDARCLQSRCALAMRLLDSRAVLGALSDLHAAPRGIRTRSAALALLFNAYALFPERAAAHQTSFFAQALFGFAHVAEAAARPGGCAALGPVGRLAFWEFVLCLSALPAALVGVAAHCKRLLMLVDSIEADQQDWRDVKLSLLGVCANRLEATRLQVSSLGTARRLLLSAQASEHWTPLVVELHFIYSLSRSIEVLRCSLADHPRLGDYTLSIARRAMALCEDSGTDQLMPKGVPQQLLTLTLQLLANLSLPVAGALRQRLLHLDSPRLLAQIASSSAKFDLRPRQAALAALSNLALRPDATDLGVSLELEAKARQRDGGSGQAVSLRHPLPPAALLKLLAEAEAMASEGGQQLAVFLAHYTRNVLTASDDLFEEEDDDDDDEEEEEEVGGSALSRLLAKLVAILLAPVEQFGCDSKEAALLALACAVAVRRSARPLSSEALCDRLLAFLRQSEWTVALQEAALYAGLRLTEALELLPWRQRFRQEVAKPDVAPLLRSEGARFLRQRLQRAALQEQQDLEELGTMSGSESS